MDPLSERRRRRNTLRNELAALYRWVNWRDDGTERTEPPPADECQQALVALVEKAYRMGVFDPARHYD